MSNPSNEFHECMIYLDNHATTPCDPRVVEAMLPWFTEHFGNPHSESHSIGRDASSAMQAAIASMASTLNCSDQQLLITSGATESINLAMRGVMTHPRMRRKHLVVCSTEHPAVLDVAADLESQGFAVTVVPVHAHDHPHAGTIDLGQLRDAITDQTALVSVMIANNEMGAIQPISEIAMLTHEAGALLHCDATQAVGRLPVDVRASDIDLLSASAHKFNGPKGTGLLVAGNGNRRVRLRPQIVGGGQQHGLRSGTMNPAGIIGMSTALTFAVNEMHETIQRVSELRTQLWTHLKSEIPGLQINGPDWTKDSEAINVAVGSGRGNESRNAGLVASSTTPASDSEPVLRRLPGNLNFRLQEIEGETWMAAVPEVAFSSGSACSGPDPSPSHVLTAMGLSESEARRSVRFGIGRFTTATEISEASQALIRGFHTVRGS